MRTCAALLVVVAVSACGTLTAGDGDDAPDGGGPDGGDGSLLGDHVASGSDAGDGGPDGEPIIPCSEDKPFGAPELLADLGILDSVRFTTDGTIAFVASGDAGDEHVFEGPYPRGALVYADVAHPPGSSTHPSPLPTGLAIVFQHRTTSTDDGIWRAFRDQPGQTFGPPAKVPIPIAGADLALHPFVLPAGDVIYFTHQTAGAGSQDLARATDTGGGTWTFADLGGVNVAGLDDADAVVSEDELVLYFSRTQGIDTDIYIASRATTAADFGTALPALPVEGLNGTATNDRPAWLSRDRCTLAFTSDRDGARRAWRATRAR